LQKDIHFNLTYALARKVGISAGDAEKIAWADQYTDDLTKADLHGIQTQSAVLGNWGDRQIQLSVLVPFHFVPGDDTERPWFVTANSSRARALVEASLSDPIRFGIALHGLQDTFSHQGFTGWEEKGNACFPWWYIIESGVPNAGHAEMKAAPDMVNLVWTDPRNGKRIDNKGRALKCARATYGYLIKFHGSYQREKWPNIAKELKQIFKLISYDGRKERLCEMAGRKIRYKNVRKRFKGKYKKDFIEAAREHLAKAMELL